MNKDVVIMCLSIVILIIIISDTILQAQKTEKQEAALIEFGVGYVYLVCADAELDMQGCINKAIRRMQEIKVE